MIKVRGPPPNLQLTYACCSCFQHWTLITSNHSNKTKEERLLSPDDVYECQRIENLWDVAKRLTSPCIFIPINPPSIPTPSANITSRGTISVVANTGHHQVFERIDCRYFHSIYLFCYFIEPSSAPIPDETFPAQINAVITGATL
jgi:hypothetical protein